jgi:hypothetical protein
MIRIARLLLLLAMMGAVALAVVATRRQRDAVILAGVSYTCPMHPRVRSPSPGECPICRMTLVSTASRGAPVRRSAHELSTLTLPPGVPPIPSHGINQANRVLVSRELLAPASLDGKGGGTALLYRDEAALLEPAERATFVRAIDASAPSAHDGIVRWLPDAPLEWDDATLRVRFQLEGPASASERLDTVGWIKLPARNRPALLVPRGAVVSAAGGPVVFVPSADGRSFSRRKVVVGRVFFGMVAILSGLSDGERIVTESAPFLEAERLIADESDGTAPRGTP